jgi:hypothetical protein
MLLSVLVFFGNRWSERCCWASAAEAATQAAAVILPRVAKPVSGEFFSSSMSANSGLSDKNQGF